MNGLKIILSAFLILFVFQSHGQFSISSLKNSGIKSEEDLKKLGISSSEIEKLKAEYLETSTQVIENEEKPIFDLTSTVENEKEIDQEEDSKEILSLVYGKSIFEKGHVELKENSDRINPPSTYRLGTGDRINITIWGTSEFSNDFTLDVFGNINPTLVGKINLKGKTFEEAKKIIKSRFANVYNLSSSKISIDLIFSKVISVNIVGEVNSPGTYSIPSINSAFNILSLANGITELGSVRNIEIRRNGKVINTLDVYQFLNNPSKFDHTYLEDGDFIIVKPAYGYININGQITRPGKYEIKENENLTSLINYAGGFTALSDKEAINIIRVEKDKLQFNAVTFDFAEKNDLKLRSGDNIKILGISSLVHGVVTITGAINVPGEYKFEKGHKILDLIKKSKGLNFNSYKKLAQVIRTQENLYKKMLSIDLNKAIAFPNGPENILLNEFDSVLIYDKNDFLLEENINISGMVQTPREIKYIENIKIKDIIAQCGGLKKEADLSKIQIERVSFQKQDSSKSYVEIIELEYPLNSEFELEPFDHINFRRLPSFQFQKTIKIGGEVKYPGNYTLNGKNERLSDLLKRSGGLTDWAFAEGAKLYRKQDSLGLLLMDLKSVIQKESSKFNYVLKHGDSITIPRTNDIVSITGAIGYKVVNEEEFLVNSPFHKGRRAGFYIKKYGGGYNEKAKQRSVYVIEYNGKVKESVFFGLIKPKINKGDRVTVNFKKPKPKKEKREAINWNNVIENTSIKLTGILTLLILSNNAFGN